MGKPFDWTLIDRNPVSPAVHSALRQALLERRAGRVLDTDGFFHDFSAGHSLLDVGMVEHDITHIQSDRWLHRKFCGWAKSVLGVDVLADEIELLKRQGFNVRLADATSDIDLGERFERIFMGEIIEHVDRPIDLLRFAARHLAPGGLILATTPNPLNFREIIATLRQGITVPNAEHVSWVTPSMALELGRRAGLDLYQYWLAQGRSRSLLKRPLHIARDLIAGKYSEFFTPQFYFLWRRAHPATPIQPSPHSPSARVSSRIDPSANGRFSVETS